MESKKIYKYQKGSQKNNSNSGFFQNTLNKLESYIEHEFIQHRTPGFQKFHDEFIETAAFQNLKNHLIELKRQKREEGRTDPDTKNKIKRLEKAIETIEKALDLEELKDAVNSPVHFETLYKNRNVDPENGQPALWHSFDIFHFFHQSSTTRNLFTGLTLAFAAQCLQYGVAEIGTLIKNR